MRLRTALVLVVTCAGIPAILLGAPVVLPHTFSNGNLADAAQINANFTTLAGALDTARLQWVTTTAASITGELNRGYIADNASRVTISLPATCAVGDTFGVAGRGAGGWKVTQAAGQTMRVRGINSPVGTTGYIQSQNAWDAMELVCVAANTTWQAVSFSGTPGYCATTSNLIQQMTSNAGPGGVASASTEYSSVYLAYYAFSSLNVGGDPPSAWLTQSTSPSGWLRYQFPSPTWVARYEVAVGSTYMAQTPRNWTFEGSHDGIVFTTLDTQTAQSGWSPSDTRSYTIASPAAYAYYRINITANNAGTAWTGIESLRMFCQ